MPVGSLQKVGSQDPCFGTSGVISKEYDFLGIPKFNETFQGPDLISKSNIQIGSKFKASLLPTLLRNSFGELNSFIPFQQGSGLIIRQHFLHQLLLDRNVILDTDFQSFLILFQIYQKGNCSIVFARLDQLVYARCYACFVAGVAGLLLGLGLLGGCL